MSISKQYIKGGTECKVRFKVTKTLMPNASSCHVVGDFNEWNPQVSPMKALKDGSFTATLNVAAPGEYNFRYLADGETWFSDSDADGLSETIYPDAKNSLLKV